MEIGKYGLPVAFLLVGITGLVWQRSHKEPRLDNREAGSNPSAEVTPSAAVSGTWTNESDWLVDGIASDLGLMVGFAAKGASLDPNAVQTVVTHEGTGADPFGIAIKGPAGSAKVSIKYQHHFWAPENYVPLATALLNEAKLKPATTTTAESTLPTTLTSPETVTLIQESKRVSAALNKQPLDAGLHDEAALIVGTLALREAAGRFADVRPALGRMTAHLALARALSNKPSTCGILAEAIQLTLVHRQVEALETIEKFPANLSAWAMALRLRNTVDWRLLKAPEGATLLEQIAYGYALVSSRDPTELAKFLDAAKPKAVPDWARMALAEDISVDEGHLFASPSVGQEFMDLELSRKAYNGERLTPDNTAAALNEAEGKAVRKLSGVAGIEVLGWGTLAAFHQRHLLHAVGRTYYFFEERWGVPEEAAKLLQLASERLSQLKFYPLLQAFGACESGALGDARERASEFCRNNPTLMTASMWGEVIQPTLSPQLTRNPPPAAPWFGNELPFGTAFDFCARECEMHGLSSERVAEAQKLAPYEFHILHVTASRLSSPDFDQMAAVFKNVIDYNVPSMRFIADEQKYDSKSYVKAMEKLAVYDPDSYIELGEALVKFGQVEEAVKAFESGVAKATDRVRVANRSEWLVNYYMDHNRTEDAVKLATEAAQVYSYRGLDTAGRLMVRLKRWQEATQMFAAIAERYDDPGPLLRFLGEQKSEPKLKEIYDKIIGSSFKEGLRSVVFADFKEAPKAGAEIKSESEQTQRYGLKVGDVVVALDGFRVDDFEQYSIVRAMKGDAEPIQIIYWDGAAYKELSASLPKRKFECEMRPYRR